MAKYFIRKCTGTPVNNIAQALVAAIGGVECLEAEDDEQV